MMRDAERNSSGIPLKVLHVTNWPGPPFDGGRINRYHVLSRLSSRHHFRFLIVREDSEQGIMDTRSLAALGIENDGVQVLTRPTVSNASRLRGLLFSRQPPGVTFLERSVGPALRTAVAKIAAEWQPDVLMIWSPNWASLLALSATHLHRILFACDCMSMLNRNIAMYSRNVVRKLYNREVARRYAAFELAYYPQYDDVVFVGQRDAAAAGLPPTVPTHVIPNGVDTDQLRPVDGKDRSGPPQIVFHGYLGYVANEACVRFLADVVGPQLAAKLGSDRFQIRVLGGGASEALKKATQGKPWLRLEGYVDDLASGLARGTIYAAPLTMGGGIKNKVLEAMACGLPVVGTKEAFEAIPVRRGIEVVESPLKAIPTEILRLLEVPDQRAALGRAARDWVVRNSNWQTVAREFERLYPPAAIPAAA